MTQQCKFLQPDVGKLLWKFRSFSIANDKKAPTQCNDMSSGVQEILLHCEVRAVIVFYHLCTHREINICGHIGLSVLICIFQPPLMNSACCCGPSGVFFYCILAQGEKGRERWSSAIFIFCRLLFVSRELTASAHLTLSSLFSHLHSLQVCKKHTNLSASFCSTKHFFNRMLVICTTMWLNYFLSSLAYFHPFAAVLIQNPQGSS